MKLNLNGNDLDIEVTESAIGDSLNSLTGEGGFFVVLSKDEMTYMQASGFDGGSYLLEYQEGDLEKHFKCSLPNINHQLVLKVFKSYYSGSDYWNEQVP